MEIDTDNIRKLKRMNMYLNTITVEMQITGKQLSICIYEHWLIRLLLNNGFKMNTINLYLLIDHWQ